MKGQQQCFKWKSDENGYLQFNFIYVKCPKVSSYRDQCLPELRLGRLTVNGAGGKGSTQTLHFMACKWQLINDLKCCTNSIQYTKNLIVCFCSGGCVYCPERTWKVAGSQLVFPFLRGPASLRPPLLLCVLPASSLLHHPSTPRYFLLDNSPVLIFAKVWMANRVSIYRLLSRGLWMRNSWDGLSVAFEIGPWG